MIIFSLEEHKRKLMLNDEIKLIKTAITKSKLEKNQAEKMDDWDLFDFCSDDIEYQLDLLKTKELELKVLTMRVF